MIFVLKKRLSHPAHLKGKSLESKKAGIYPVKAEFAEKYKRFPDSRDPWNLRGIIPEIVRAISRKG